MFRERNDVILGVNRCPRPLWLLGLLSVSKSSYPILL